MQVVKCRTQGENGYGDTTIREMPLSVALEKLFLAQNDDNMNVVYQGVGADFDNGIFNIRFGYTINWFIYYKDTGKLVLHLMIECE